MSDELTAKLLAKLPPIHPEPAAFGKTQQSHAMETQLGRLAGLSMDEETEKLREILQTVGKVP
jgi:hypothetical protein